MSEPLVCAILLTKDRPKMALRAYRCFEEQTQAHRIIILDSGRPFTPNHCREVTSRTCCMNVAGQAARSIGELRNLAVRHAVAQFSPDIFIHFDDDDVSHPNRIAEQVAHLQRSGADVVGYNEMLFWRSPRFTAPGEAWLLKNRNAHWGTSFCYWRKTWERKPFLDLPKRADATGEDFQWAMGLRLETEPGFRGVDGTRYDSEPEQGKQEVEPRLICSILGGNTMDYSDLTGPSWSRVPEWDAYCAERMKL